MRRRWVPWLAGALALALTGAAAWYLAGPGRPRPAEPVSGAASAEQAYRRAMDLASAGRYLESLPDFRAAVEARPDLWSLHHDYGSALLNTVHEGRRHLGQLEFVLRSSFERVAMLREGLAHLDAAERLAREPRARAQILRTRAQILKAWGLSWNAFVSYRASEWADTTWRESAAYSNAFMDLMEDPTRPEK